MNYELIKVSYIWHDCFVVELAHATLVFDYWRDVDGERRQLPAFLGSIRRDVPLYVFVSHFHKDHYNPDIFAWQSQASDVRYFVSLDVWKRMRHIVSDSSVYAGPKVSAERVTVLRPGGEWTSPSGLVTVHAFQSTDIGNAWLVRVGDRRVFHAGDLNAWVWRDDSTEREIKAALSAFRSCIRPIHDKLRRGDAQGEYPIDICFFPVDSRIGSGYTEGASIFVRKFDVRNFFPMHFALGDAGERERRRKDALRFDLYANPDRGNYLPLTEPGASVEVD